MKPGDRVRCIKHEDVQPCPFIGDMKIVVPLYSIHIVEQCDVEEQVINLEDGDEFYYSLEAFELYSDDGGWN